MSKSKSKGLTSEEVYAQITNSVLAKLDEGVVAWRRPWKEIGLQRNYNSKRAYRGLNQLILSLSGYSCPFWATGNAINKAEGRIIKGEKSTIIPFWKMLHFKDPDNPGEDGKPGVKSIPLLRYWRVFNLEQTTLEIPEVDGDVYDFEPIEEAERIVAEMENRPPITHGGNRAAYSPLKDEIYMPEQKQFKIPEEYYSTIFHELGHATGHESRLNRKEGMAIIRRGDEEYSKEELIAEMCAAMVCGIVGIDSATIDNTAAYIASWKKKLTDNPKWLVQAGGKAAKAADLIQNITAEDRAKEREEAKEAVAA